MKRRILFICGSIIAILILAVLIIDGWRTGREIDRYRGVPVYDNGLLFFRSHGKHFGTDGYYLGQKWQCVEFIKRFYYEAKKHRMPEVMGHAKSFFDLDLTQGQINEKRGLIQFQNGSNVAPKADDLIVFTDTKYGHVGIVTVVEPDSVEIIQQNILGKTRQKLHLTQNGDRFLIDSPKVPAGWLRQK